MHIQLAVQNNLALTLEDRNEFEHSEALFQAALIQCQEMGLRHREAAMLNNLADLAHQQGHKEESMDFLKRAVVIFTEIGQETGEHQPEIWKLSEW